MFEQIEGSKAMARTIALCRPQVVCAYPITPQTHIVEGVGELIRLGRLENCEFINVESEFAALSVAIGASAAGARAYTATASLTSSATGAWTRGSPGCRRSPIDTSRTMGSWRRRREMKHPYAIALDVGTSKLNLTGSWRTQRPI
jgi:hypothetical protein